MAKRRLLITIVTSLSAVALAGAGLAGITLIFAACLLIGRLVSRRRSV